MFDHLVESNRRGRRDVRGTMLGMFTSTAFQAAVMAGAVYATMATPTVAPLVPTDSIILLPPDPRPKEQPDERPVITTLHPLPVGFRNLELPAEIPSGIPRIDLTVTFDPRDYTGTGVEGGVFDGDPNVTGPVTDLTRLYEHGVVDEKPERIACPALEYPRMMRQAGVEGAVLLRFVVETDGHVHAEHIETLSATHRAFEGPARDMLAKCVFRPGRVRSSAVRVLVQMPVIFDLANR